MVAKETQNDDKQVESNASNDESNPKDKQEEPIVDEEENSQENINEDLPEKYEDSHGVDMKPVDDVDPMQIEDDFDLGDLNIEDAGDNNQMEDGDNTQGDSDADSVKGSSIDNHEEMPVDMEDETNTDDLINENMPSEIEKNTDHLEDEKADVENNEEDPDCMDPDVADTHPANGVPDELQPAEKYDEENHDVDIQPDLSSKKSESFGVEGTLGDQSAPSKNTENLKVSEGENSENIHNDAATAAQSQEENRSSGVKANPLPNLAQKNNEPNPHRSVGDATERWQKRLKNISDSVAEFSLAETPSGGMDEDNEFEYVQENDEDQGETQALGVADQNQTDKMDTNGLFKDGDDSENAFNDEIIELDEKDSEPIPTQSIANIIEKGIKDTTKRQEILPDYLEKINEIFPDYSNEIELVGKDEEAESFPRNHPINMEIETISDELEPLMNKDYFELRQELETRMAEWRKTGNDLKTAQDLWNNYATLTRDLSFSLCEQLRLILEPTLGIF
jgi:midasin (ATPase involved in ribosome maturation)